MLLIFLLIGFIGFTDAVYLTATHYAGANVACGALEGCDKVLASAYSVFAGLPVALLGAIYYLLLIAFLLCYLATKQKRFLFVAAGLTPVGFLVSVWFLYLQIFVIKALCFYCLISAATSATLFIIGLYILLTQGRGLLRRV
ncbi:MAG: vitamin K epoxide reductase family protein [Candidatus Giovannonibacteria bacterium]|nr:MAG: vitamin K epoxide reductase family protein [Candidatus Giovannonibacteria bacterium]